MQGLAAILYPLVLMLVALGMGRLENLVTRESGTVSPDQMDSLLDGVRVADVEIVDVVAPIAVLPTTFPDPADGARRAS